MHLLAAAFWSDTTFGAALRASAVAEEAADLERAVAGRAGDPRIPVHRLQAAPDVMPLLEGASQRARADGRIRLDAEDLVWALTVVLGPHSRFFASEPAARTALARAPEQFIKPHRPGGAPRPPGRRAGGLLWAGWKPS